MVENKLLESIVLFAKLSFDILWKFYGFIFTHVSIVAFRQSISKRIPWWLFRKKKQFQYPPMSGQRWPFKPRAGSALFSKTLERKLITTAAFVPANQV